MLSAVPGLVSRDENFDNSGYRWLLYLSPYLQILAFIAGILTCQLYRVTRDCHFAPAVVSTIGWAATLGTAILWVKFNWLGRDGVWLTAQTFGAYVVNLHLNMLFVPLCCLLIYALAIGPSSLARLLSLPVVVLFGETSYSMYLGHPLAQGIASKFTARDASRLPFVPVNSWFILSIGAIFGLSLILYLLVEVPAKRAIRDYWRSRRRKTYARRVRDIRDQNRRCSVEAGSFARLTGVRGRSGRIRFDQRRRDVTPNRSAARKGDLRRISVDQPGVRWQHAKCSARCSC